MLTAGIICEYNPFHAGHRLQIERTRAVLGQGAAVVCLMSGNYVQRGEPAIWPKQLRAEAAVRSGADLILELPLTVAVNAGGYFASGAVTALRELGCIDVLSFGSECGELALLQRTADALCAQSFEEEVHKAMEEGVSYPRARSRALAQLGGDGALLEAPNNALAVDYLCALKRLDSKIRPLTICRDMEIPGATALRMTQDEAEFLRFVPENMLYRGQQRHTLAAGERAMLAVLRTRSDAEFEAMPFGGEGLWSKVMKACRREPGLQEILTACKSKRYTMSRLKRMLLCLFLGLSGEDLQRRPPYLRVLAFNERGRAVLHTAAETSALPLVSGAIPKEPEARAYFRLESRAADLYALFSEADFHTPVGQERAWHPVYIR